MSDDRSVKEDGDLAASIAAGYSQIAGAAVMHVAKLRGVKLQADIVIQARADLSSGKMAIRLTVHVKDATAREIALAALSMMPSTTDRGDLVLADFTVGCVSGSQKE